MKVKLEYTIKARADLSKFKANLRERIVLKLEFFCYKSEPMKHAKLLTGSFKGFYRFRIGDYRAIFKKDAQGRLVIVTIIRIKHRKDSY